MARPKLTPEEREARRRERARFSFSDAAYRHYDPRVSGYGSAEDWINAAESLTGNTHDTTRVRREARAGRPGRNPDLAILNLDDFPADLAGLKTAFRNTMFVVHPDHGGSNEACREALTAFERLSKFYK